jgi:hypothetical protein
MCVHGAPFLPRCATSGRVALSRAAHYRLFLAWTQTPQPQAPQSLSAKGAVATWGFGEKIRHVGVGKSRACEHKLSCFGTFTTEPLTAHALPAILTAAARIGAQSASSVTVRLPHGVQRSSRTGCINMRRPNTRTFCSGLCFRCALYHSPYHADAFFRRRAI